MRTAPRPLVLLVLMCVALSVIVTAGWCAAAPADPMAGLVVSEAQTDAGDTVTILSPYRNYANWYKGQLHAHTTNSDGGCTPPQLEAKYRRVGVDFLAITDHERITPDPQAEDGQDVPVSIPSEEHGTREGHMVFIRVGEHIAAPPGQEAIDKAVAAGALVMLCHPDWAASYGADELDRLTGYQFIEVMNAGTRDENQGMGDGSRAWDYLLGQGKVIWGTSTDDFHGKADSPLPAGYCIVNAPELTADAILANLIAGNFYATEGPELHLTLEGNKLTVTSDEPQSVFFRGRGGTALVATRLDGQQRKSATYAFKGDEGYVRVEVFRYIDGLHAWSQPIFVRK